MDIRRCLKIVICFVSFELNVKSICDVIRLLNSPAVKSSTSTDDGVYLFQSGEKDEPCMALAAFTATNKTSYHTCFTATSEQKQKRIG